MSIAIAGCATGGLEDDATRHFDTGSAELTSGHRGEARLPMSSSSRTYGSATAPPCCALVHAGCRRC